MSGVRIHGHLVCADAEESRIVAEHLPAHAALTRAEPGCVSFSVEPTGDPLVWRVEEVFRDAQAVDAHRSRMEGGAWSRATAGIARRYATVEEPGQARSRG